MKSLVLFIAIVCIVGVNSLLTREQKRKIHKNIDECIVKTELDPNVFDNLRQGKDIPPSEKLDCFSACMFKKNGVMNEDGTVVHRSADTEKMTECKNLSGKDVCSTAGKIMSCYHQYNLIPKFKQWKE